MAAATNKYGAPRRVRHNYEGNFLFQQKRLLNVECGNPEGEIENDEVITYKILKTEFRKHVGGNGETVMEKSVDVNNNNNSHASIEQQLCNLQVKQDTTSSNFQEQIKNLTEKLNKLETSLETSFVKKKKSLWKLQIS